MRRVGGGREKWCDDGNSAPFLSAHKREEADRLAGEITRQGMRTSSYHAGLPQSERDATQDLWMRGAVRFVVATGEVQVAKASDVA